VVTGHKKIIYTCTVGRKASIFLQHLISQQFNIHLLYPVSIIRSAIRHYFRNKNHRPAPILIMQSPYHQIQTTEHSSKVSHTSIRLSAENTNTPEYKRFYYIGRMSTTTLSTRMKITRISAPSPNSAFKCAYLCFLRQL
jgi:hypothetical protein